ncbi:MAG: hydrolase [Phycisphaeraceae bacterium]|nr:MAG: hydrolase [Phycisphaeraceae bacterium]
MTLIESGGVGLRSMVAAGRRLFGEGFTAEGIAFGGQLDPLILAQMFAQSGVDPTPDALASFREAYAAELALALETPGVSRTLAGVPELLGALDDLADACALGVLTGNFEETGRLKLAAAGIDADRFAVRVWGDHSPHDPPAREHLPPVAFVLHEKILGRTIDPGLVTLVGDTEHDVRAAKMNGCRVLGVATGYVSAEQLAKAGADRVVDDLTNTRGVVQWLTMA